MITALGDLVQVLGTADPDDKADVYTGLGLTLTSTRANGSYTPQSGQALICAEGVCPRGERTEMPIRHIR